MDGAFDIPDPTDWLGTPMSGLAEVENALHCRICKEFYDTPMITSCSHSFCSKCIRTSLSADGKCPACRAPDQASKLRNNWALQELVNSFVAGRKKILQAAQRLVELEKPREQQIEMEQQTETNKRKSEVIVDEGERENPRRKSRRLAESSQSSRVGVIEIDDASDVEDEDFKPAEIEDGLVWCPGECGRRMTVEAVQLHIDRCLNEKAEDTRQKSRPALNGFRIKQSSSPTQPDPIKPVERLSELNYSMMKESALAKKLRELDISSSGAKALMVRRHIEWVNIWNANCDSSRPRSKQALKRDLEVWESTQGAPRPSTVNRLHDTITRKDFDSAGWANRNKDDFTRLIAEATRKTSTSKPEQHSKQDDSKGADDTVEEATIEQGVTESQPDPVVVDARTTADMSMDNIEQSHDTSPPTPVPLQNGTRKMPMFTVPESLSGE